MNKLEEMPVEEAKNEVTQNLEKDDTEDNSSNYITAYNKEKHKYEIYSEEELLNTSKQTVLTENEKIEKDNLSNLYSAQISKNVSRKGKKYEIYSEEELLNTSKQTVLTENEKIEKDNLSNLYSAQISKNVSRKGKTVIYVIICVVIIILVILLKKKRE